MSTGIPHFYYPVRNLCNNSGLDTTYIFGKHFEKIIGHFSHIKTGPESELTEIQKSSFIIPLKKLL